MATVVIDVYSKAFPDITNRIRAAVFLETDLLAPIATLIDTTAGHPIRLWHFPGLPRANYAFSLDEINGSGDPINNLALFDLVPPAIGNLLSRMDEQIKVGTTTGFDAGLQVVVFDGTGGKPDYLGWDIVPSELTGRGILALDLDYTWNKDTGTFTLLQVGDVLTLNTIYNIHFNPQADTTGGSVPTVLDFSTRLITATGNIEVSDFGNNIIFEPAGNYIEATLPDITTVAQGRVLRIEMISIVGSGVKCVRVLPNDSDTINWLRGNIWMMNCESLEIYRYRRPDLSNEWRVRLPDGNFKTVGNSVGIDQIQSGVYCSQLLDGSSRDKFQYARVYNEIVLNLPNTQRVNYDDWSTGNNKYLWSLANSSDPDFVNQFHFPDRRDLYERNNNAGKSGDYLRMMIEEHAHQAGIQDGVSGGVGGYGRNTGQSGIAFGLFAVSSGTTRVGTSGVLRHVNSNQMSDLRADATSISGSETRPESYLINKYILI